MTEDQKLEALFAASNEAELERNPLEALFRGDMRYAERFGDYISDQWYDAEYRAAEDDLAKLDAIDRTKLSPTNRIAAEVFDYDQRLTLRQYAPALRALQAVRPIDHFTGVHTFYPTFASGRGIAPFETVEDYENNLERHEGFIAYLDASIGRFREGMESGVFDTKLTIQNVIDQLDAQLAMPIAQSPFMGPLETFPDDIADADTARLEQLYEVKTQEIYDAYQRLRDFLAEDYLPSARDAVGLSAMKGGENYYTFLIERNTTLPLSAEEVHQLGLSEVKRVASEMDRIRQEVGFDGTLSEFFDFVRDDPQFHPQSREWMTQRFYDIGTTVDQRVAALFSHMPETPLEIRPYEPFREKYEAGGSYQSGTAEGDRPGIFWFNAYDLPSRSIPGMTTLYLHEAAPGHHFQISLAQENKALPDFMRFGGNTAYVEGWALYAESLGHELGMYDDPYQLFGHLDDEMLRAMRLVVDTGLHAKRWSREQAIQYMLDNSSMGRADATAEVERYIAMPGQALAYKIGALTIQKLRTRAKDRLGERFDIKAFHDQILGTGALPLPVLEAKIDAWIDGQAGTSASAVPADG